MLLYEKPLPFFTCKWLVFKLFSLKIDTSDTLAPAVFTSSDNLGFLINAIIIIHFYFLIIISFQKLEYHSNTTGLHKLTNKPINK